MGTASAFTGPEYNTITPYLLVDGAARMLEFVKQAFGAEELMRHTHPQGGGIMHAEFRIGDSKVAVGESEPKRVALHLYVENVDEVYRQALEAGAKSTQEPIDQPYGDREAGIEDPLGNTWYIATHLGGTHVPEGLRAVTPYLHPHNAAALIGFLTAAFGAEAVAVYRDSEPDGRIAHAKVRIGDSMIEMSDAHGPYQPMPPCLWMHVDDVDAVYERAVQSGATVMSPPEDKAYGERSAGVKDPSENVWYIASPLRR